MRRGISKLERIFHSMLALFVSCALLLGSPNDAWGQNRPTPLQTLQQRGFETSPDNLKALALDEFADLNDRVLAIHAFTWTIGADYSDVLITLLDDSNQKIRLSAIHGFSSNENVNAPGALVRLLDSDYPEVRAAVAVKLAINKDDEAIGTLVDLLNAGYKPTMTYSFTWALAEIGSDASTDALVRIGADPNYTLGTRLDALSRLVLLNDFDKLDYVRNHEYLEPLLEDTNTDFRERAAILIARGGDNVSIPILFEVTGDKTAEFVLRLRAANLIEALTDVDFGFAESSVSISMWRAAIDAKHSRSQPVDSPEFTRAREKLANWWAEHRTDYETVSTQTQ